jgi:hypothetical protein
VVRVQFLESHIFAALIGHGLSPIAHSPGYSNVATDFCRPHGKARFLLNVVDGDAAKLCWLGDGFYATKPNLICDYGFDTVDFLFADGFEVRRRVEGRFRGGEVVGR